MSAEISGAIEHLIYLLEKQFSPAGNPPQPPEWSFHVDEQRDDPAGYLGDQGAFGALIEDEPSEPIQEALQQIPPLAEVATAMRHVRSLIGRHDHDDMHHLQNVFLRLINSSWVESISNSSEYRDEPSYRFGYTLAAVDRQLLAELREAARKATAIPSKRSTPTVLNATQRAAFEIIRDEGPILGKTLAKRLGIAGDTLRKHVLPSLKKHGLINQRNGSGYSIE